MFLVLPGTSMVTSNLHLCSGEKRLIQLMQINVFCFQTHPRQAFATSQSLKFPRNFNIFDMPHQPQATHNSPEQPSTGCGMLLKPLEKKKKNAFMASLRKHGSPTNFKENNKEFNTFLQHVCCAWS